MSGFIAARRLCLLKLANDGDAILDDLDDPEAIQAELGLMAGAEAAEAHRGGQAALGRSRGWSARRVMAIVEGVSAAPAGVGASAGVRGAR